jgi:hypothetical protein
MKFLATVRYGRDRHRYHPQTLEAENLRAAMELLLRTAPSEVLDTADLAEIRIWNERPEA